MTQSGQKTPSIAAVIVLAAGQGTRMRSALPKVLHPLVGRPLLWHALRCAAALAPQRLVTVVGHDRQRVESFLHEADGLDGIAVSTAVQPQQHGTGHAVKCALETTGDLDGTVIVTYGDVPLLRSRTLAALASEHQESDNAVTVLTAEVDDPSGYGRIVRDDTGAIRAIVEHRDADAAVRGIHEINSGVYAFDGALLRDSLRAIGSANEQGEQYLTDVLRVAVDAGRRVGSVTAQDPSETEGVNDRVQLADMAGRLRARLIRDAQLAGVTIHDPATTYLDADVTIGQDTEILPGTHLQAGTAIGSDCQIGPDTTLSACTVDDGAVVIRSHCSRSHIAGGATVGPYSHLRDGTEIGCQAVIGAFVETKKAQIEAGAKAHHLAYLGDVHVGARANIGAGVITANYDGQHKARTEIGCDSFVGSNSTLVAPVTIADGAYVAAGSTVTDNVEPGDLAVARGRQHNSVGWVHKKRFGSASDDAAEAAKTTDLGKGN